MIRHIIFDLDGTLVDSLETFLKLGNELAIKYGYQPVSQERIRELLELPMKKRLRELKIPIFKLPKLGVELLNSYHSYAEEVSPIAGVREMLTKLHAEGYGLSIVSSNSVQNIQNFLETNNLKLFDHVQSSKGLFSKHVTIGRLISKLGVEKREVIYIGDEQRDVEACRKIGIRVISVLWGFDSLKLLKKVKPDFIVSKPQEIVEIITSIE